VVSKGLNDSEAVLSVPSYYTEMERKAFLDAASMINLKVLKLMNESSAIALSYGIFRKAELDETAPKHVVFVDFGHSKLEAFVASFTKGKAKIVA
jgi:molecular chaperone DnaK (HSP70)